MQQFQPAILLNLNFVEAPIRNSAALCWLNPSFIVCHFLSVLSEFSAKRGCKSTELKRGNQRDSYSCNGALPVLSRERYHPLCASRTHHLLRACSRSAESLSPAIIPNKTSVVIPAMFHHSVAAYSEAHCRCMLASTKIITRECLCVCCCSSSLSSFLQTNTSKRSWTDNSAFTAVALWIWWHVV